MENLEVYISCVNGYFSATIQGFHRFQIGNNSISKLLSDMPTAIQNHLVFCRANKYNYPQVICGEYQISYKYSIYTALELMPDLLLLSKETKISQTHLRSYVEYTRKPNGQTYKKVFSGINGIGEKICAMKKPNFLLCSNEELIAEYSHIPLSEIQAYKSGKVIPKAETQEKLLSAMHKIGELYRNMTWR